MTKLAIIEERDEDKYDIFTTVKCWACDAEKGFDLPDLSADPQVRDRL